MEEHDYVYQLKPLIVSSVMFLILYPLVIGGVHYFSQLPVLELKILTGIYLTAVVGILSLWLIGKSQHVQIKDGKIVFHSLLGKHIIEPLDIRRVAFYFDGKGQEVAQIRTESKFYYVSEFYFPFPELMNDLEIFIRQHGLRSNLESYAGLNQ